MASLPRPVMRVFRAMPEAVRQRAVRAASPSYTLGAQAHVTRDDGRVLLVKAAYRWRWGMPGGLMNQGEGPEEAVIRETKEETGLDIVVDGDPVVLVETAMQRVNFIYSARPAPGSDPDALVAQAAEILELGWFAPEEFPETIPDMSGELVFGPDAAPDGPAVIVTNALAGDQPL